MDVQTDQASVRSHTASSSASTVLVKSNQSSNTSMNSDSKIMEVTTISTSCSDIDKESSTMTTATTSENSSIHKEEEKGGQMEAPLQIIYGLPPAKKLQRGPRFVRHVLFTVYRRLFTIVWLANISTFVYIMYQPEKSNNRVFNLATAASANLFCATAIRQDYIINWLCELAILTPWSTPLRIRRIIAKVYEFGGLHSGAATACVGWLIYLTGYLTSLAADGSFKDVRILAFAYVIVMLFLSIVIFAMPWVRKRAHNSFERTHRFAGWTTTIFFWTLILLLAQNLGESSGQSIAQVLSTLPSFYLVFANTINTILPWIPKYRLRKLPTIAEHLSSRAIRLHLKADIGEFYTIRISDNPLSEWHSFACFQDRIPSQGMTNSVIVAKAGDWTSKTILQPRDYYWTRGQPTRGVLYMSLMFRKVVVVTTGSGIGPCLNLLALNSRKRPECRVLWSTPFPEETYGKEILDTVKEADNNALIWDTKKLGRPDMLALTWQLYKESGAEAVFVISNPAVTKLVVYGMESRGVPAFGPVFDS